ncbi:MAG: hypothetical protein ANABAC_0645 [Anaerolineae bacterium]|nr:MAG: hypothetical protein ANABAC_0645 [Anaerolineae bacterium]
MQICKQFPAPKPPWQQQNNTDQPPLLSKPASEPFLHSVRIFSASPPLCLNKNQPGKDILC